MKLLVINGVNLNMLGIREPGIYGSTNYDSLCEMIKAHCAEKGVEVSLVHLGTPKEQWFESYAFYPKHGYCEYEPGYMRKEL